jgi:hypothetical protein
MGSVAESCADVIFLTPSLFATGQGLWHVGNEIEVDGTSAQDSRVLPMPSW